MKALMNSYLLLTILIGGAGCSITSQHESTLANMPIIHADLESDDDINDIISRVSNSIDNDAQDSKIELAEKLKESLKEGKGSIELQVVVNLFDILVKGNDLKEIEHYNILSAPLAVFKYNSNHLVFAQKHMSERVEIWGKVRRVKEQQNGDYHVHFECFNLLQSYAHRVDNMYARLYSGTIRKYDNPTRQLARGSVIRVSGFIIKDENDLVILVQGKYEIVDKLEPKATGNSYNRINPQLPKGITDAGEPVPID